MLAACSGGASDGETPPAPDESASAPAAGEFTLPTAVEQVDPATLPNVVAQLGVPPMAAPPTGRTSPANVTVEIEVVETTREIADGATFNFWTFGGTVPGPMIRVRRGDHVTLRLQNHPDNTMPHNIDLHAVTGPGGGATSTFTAPGHQTQFSFQALNAGVYVYHCATAPVGMHVANGMYGLIVVEPEEGWPAADHEYYVMQGDFYTTGNYRAAGLQPFDMQRAIDENPSYVLFNGRDGALVGEGALTANTGERVRIFFGNGGPNLISSFHVIGEIFDRVWQEGGTRVTQDVQTTLVPAGGAAFMDFGLEVPGTYILVDHSLLRAFNKGALGMLRVSGEPQTIVYSGQEVDEVYLGDQAPEVVAALEAAPSDQEPLAVRMTRGEATYRGVCAACHQRTGEGLAGVFPPLAGSEYMQRPDEELARIVLSGLTGPITVNGQAYNGVMPGLANLTDHEIADVLTYVRGNLGNHQPPVSNEVVAAARRAMPQPDPGAHP
ncbi:MAG: nitrite reductase, copper-containing [Sandaracinaceae bacterium]|nr:nitrite reductase, copper-containing [Sandaracinaceae bacterium]